MAGKSTIVRRAAVLGSAVALACGLGMGAASAAPASSGGGCTGNVNVGSGWVVNSCISATNWVVHPDGYVAQTGDRGSNCTIYVDVIKDGSVIGTNTYDCSVTGHIYGPTVSGSGSFFTGIYVVHDGQYTSEAISPYEYN